MPSYKLSYFDVKGRGEAIRLALHWGGIQFADDRISMAGWPSRKPEFPFQQVPVLEVDGLKLAQTIAILRYVGALAGLRPKDDPLQDAKVDMFVCAADDLFHDVVALFRTTDEGQREAIRKDLAERAYPPRLTYIEKQVGTNGHCVGDKLTIADLGLFGAMSTLADMGLASADAYPNIKRVCDKVVADEKIASWYRSH